LRVRRSLSSVQLWGSDWLVGFLQGMASDMGPAGSLEPLSSGSFKHRRLPVLSRMAALAVHLEVGHEGEACALPVAHMGLVVSPSH
jgi:hypothetical protein